MEWALHLKKESIDVSCVSANSNVFNFIQKIHRYEFGTLHWKEKKVILTKLLSAAPLNVVILTTSSVASEENFIKMTEFLYQYKKRA